MKIHVWNELGKEQYKFKKRLKQGLEFKRAEINKFKNRKIVALKIFDWQ